MKFYWCEFVKECFNERCKIHCYFKLSDMQPSISLINRKKWGNVKKLRLLRFLVSLKDI